VVGLVSKNIFHRFAGVFDGTFNKIYTDGWEVNSGRSASTVLDTITSTYLGENGFDGMISFVAVWNRVISSQEILLLEADELLNLNTTGLQLLFTFEEGSGNLLHDSSGYGRDGLMNNAFPLWYSMP